MSVGEQVEKLDVAQAEGVGVEWKRALVPSVAKFVIGVCGVQPRFAVIPEGGRGELQSNRHVMGLARLRRQPLFLQVSHPMVVGDVKNEGGPLMLLVRVNERMTSELNQFRKRTLVLQEIDGFFFCD